MEKDFWVLLSLEMDLPDIINTCLCSRKIHSYVCENKYFWMNKVKKDFGIKEDKENAKSYYFKIYKLLKRFSLGEILDHGLKEQEQDKVLIAIHKNVDIRPLFKYRRYVLEFLNSYLKFFPRKEDDEAEITNINPDLVIMFVFLYDKILPEVRIISEPKFWGHVYKKLLYYKSLPEVIDVYKRRGEFYKSLASSANLFA